MLLSDLVESVSGFGYSSSIDVDNLTIKELSVLVALPHGSGINYDWHVSHRSDGRLVASNAYHGMNEYGMYVSSIDFSIIYTLDFSDFHLVFHSKDRYWINRWWLPDYLGEMFEYSRSEALKELSKV